MNRKEEKRKEKRFLVFCLFAHRYEEDKSKKEV
jgi:hypothetical protein